MDLDPRQLIAQAKALPRALKIVAAIAVVDLAILVLAAFTLEDEVDDRAARVDQAKSELVALRNKVETTRKQIGGLPELRKKYDAAMSDGVLADQDRQTLIGHAQDLGLQHRLSDLHYKLEPQKAEPGTTPAFSLVTTPVSLAANALLDSDLLEFWDEVLSNLQAHYQITKATLSRSEAEPQAVLDGIRSGRPIVLVKSELNFRWVSLRKVAPAVAAPAASATAPAPATAPVKAADAQAPQGATP
jgi:hypothetical protein